MLVSCDIEDTYMVQQFDSIEEVAVDHHYPY